MILTSCTPALGMLTFQLVSLSKPVGPNMLMNFFMTPCWAFPFLQKGRAFGSTWYLPLSLTQNLSFVIPRLAERPNVGSKANKSL